MASWGFTSKLELRLRMPGLCVMVCGMISCGQCRWLIMAKPSNVRVIYSPLGRIVCVMRVLYFAGTTYQLNPSFPDGTAIHGVCRSFAWRVVSSDATHIELHFDTRLHSGVNFPFAFKAWVEYRLDGANFSTRMGLTNLDSKPMPAGFGTHPFIQRTLTGSDDVLFMQIPCDSAYPLVDCMPTGAPQPIPVHLDFRQLRQVGSDFADDCLTGRQIGESIVLRYGASDTQITHWMDHLYFACGVVYAQRAALHCA
jgi:aldose 1-epimerase